MFRSQRAYSHFNDLQTNIAWIDGSTLALTNSNARGSGLVRPQNLLRNGQRACCIEPFCLKNTLFTIISIEQLGIYLKNTFGEQKWKSSKLTPGYETKIYFSIIVGGCRWPLHVTCVISVNFTRLWKYLYDQSMWMFRIAICRLLICFFYHT